MTTPLDIVNRYLDAFSQGPEGAPAGLALIHDDFQFDGPMLQARNKQEFIEGLASMGPMTPKINMLTQLADGEDVCSIYEFIVGENPPVVMAEWSQVRKGKIVRQRLVYDSAQMKPAG